MAGVMRLRPEHVGAVSAGPGGPCTDCTDTEGWRAPALPAADRVLEVEVRCHQVKDYLTFDKIERGGKRPGSDKDSQYTDIPDGHWVYLFRWMRGHARAELVATFDAATKFRGVVPWCWDPARDGDLHAMWVFVSHVELLPARLEEYCSHFDLLCGRCRFHTLANSDGSVDLVLVNMYQFANEAHDQEKALFAKLHALMENTEAAQERFLADLTLSVAAQYQRHDKNVWDWFARVNQQQRSMPTEWRGARPTPLCDKPYTVAEAVLADHAYEVAKVTAQLTPWTRFKYLDILQSPMFRHMRYDVLGDPTRNRANIIDQAHLITPALQSAAGQEYLRKYVLDGNNDGSKDGGDWFTRFLCTPQAHEVEAFLSDSKVAEAYWAILATIGATLVSAAGNDTELGQETDRTNQIVEFGKSAAGAWDEVTRARWEGPAKQTRRAAEQHGRRAAQARAALRKAADAQRAAAWARHVAASPVNVLQEYLLLSIGRFTGSRPPIAVYDTAQWRFVAVDRHKGTFTVSRSSTLGAESPSVRESAAAADRRADAAARKARVSRLRVAQAEQQFLDVKAFEKLHADRAWASTAAVVAMGVINLCLALKAQDREPNEENRWKLTGAIADLLFGSEYALLRLPPAGAANAGRSLGSVALVGVRVFGLVGGGISTYYAFRDADRARRGGEADLFVGSVALGAGSLMVTLGILGATLVSFELGGVAAVALLASAGWTIVGAVLALVGAGVLLLFTNSAIENWVRESRFGEQSKNKPIVTELRELLQLVCTPALTAEAYAAGHSDLPAGVTGRGIRATMQLPLFFPRETVLAVTLRVMKRSLVDGRDRASWRWEYDTSKEWSFTIALTNAAAQALVAGGRVTLAVVEGVQVVMRREGGSTYACDVYLPFAHTVDVTRKAAASEAAPYACGGKAHLRLWERHDDSAWRDIKLEPVHMREVKVATPL